MNKQKKNGFYSKLELAMELRVCVRTLEKLMREGKLSYVKVKSRVIFSQEDVDAFCERSRREAFGVDEESLKRYLD